MNVYSLITDPSNPLPLTEHGYNQKTKRLAPYVQTINTIVKAFALCPGCKNPVILINRTVPDTEAVIMYAKHTGYDVQGLAKHVEAEYLDCDLANPARFDSKARRTSAKRNNEIHDAMLNHFDLVIQQLEQAIGIKFTDNVIEAMVRDFAGNRGYEYQAITLFNLPFGFAYMTEAKDLYGCKVSGEVAKGIEAGSQGFTVKKYFDTFTVERKKPSPSGTGLRLYFNRHGVGEVSGKDSIQMVVVETNSVVDQSTELYKTTIEFDGAKFYNFYRRKERLRQIAEAQLGR
ncbi:hypothetical protein C4K03_2380 [Pseudomonas synxantha]|uniref:Uncharacterized protein n=1 Tax=Pseudomonas synxantha TaxID=47883 RepID=A0A3G7U585_9PSED|nr:hypothetical protein [Pseudomonas synxantha]AZE54535.1 hypothetical protein C4K03_2380 [Pseudomonas synxantha]